MTSVQPTNASEWQLYRVLQRANLLQYYDTFIAQGGDDVQQLCEAGEEEFLEIMALVGMASKPLHVRRLQKALQEWVANPAAFQGPVVGSTSPAPGSITASVREQNAMSYQMHSTPVVNAPAWSPQMSSHQPPRNISPVNTGSPLGASPQADIKEIDMNQHSQSPLPTPILVESQINAIAEAADRVAKELPPFEPKELNLKKQINRELQVVMSMSPEDPNRMEELRKYAAIYGRFDSKRKGDKPMSLHEISVNEAAAQLCHHIPALLTRREDLFPLSRQIVRDSGYQYSKGHSRTELFTECRPRKRKRSNDCGILDGEIESAASDPLAVKRPKMEPVFQRHHDNNPKTVKAELSQILREEQMSALDKELTSTKQKQENIRCQIQVAKDADDIALIKKLQGELELVTTHQLHLLAEQSDVIRKQHLYERYQMTKTGCINNSNHDDDGTDSSNLPSSSSSPLNDSRDGDFDFEKNDLFDTARKKVKRNQLIQETLFDEGLRIAQQYGMADFAEELKDLQRQKTPQNGHGKNKGWNNQCERKGESDQGVADGDNDIDNDVDNDIDCSDNDSNNKDAESEISVGEIEKCDSEANNDKENQNCSIVQDSNCVN